MKRDKEEQVKKMQSAEWREIVPSSGFHNIKINGLEWFLKIYSWILRGHGCGNCGISLATNSIENMHLCMYV